jgi:DNA-directed RNA polymerase subunit F
MPPKAMRERLLTVPEVKKALELIGEDKLDQFQHRSLDYASKFAKVGDEEAEAMFKKTLELKPV